MKKSGIVFTTKLLATLAFASIALATSAEHHQRQRDFIYFNDAQLRQVKAEIVALNPYFLQRYQSLLQQSDALLDMPADPVVNKTMKTPSGDNHDYISYAPYRWPDETKKDGLPWKAIDGVTNPVSRGPDTDHTRLGRLLSTVEKLSFAYYFSGDPSYSDKALELLNIWFLDPKTKVNPNVNYGQAVPGIADGRAAGLIDWARFPNVITAVQIFSKAGVMPEKMETDLRAWMSSYLDWLLTSDIGRETDALPQNHANWYNCQVVGLMIFLDRIDEAKARVEDAKTSRIAAQIEPDGQQPLELGRTRSVHYSTMNLWALVNLAYMGQQVNVDLMAFETDDGRSLKQAFQYLLPYALGEKEWTHKQLGEGGAPEAIRKELKPMLSNAASLLDLELSTDKLDIYNQLSPLDALTHPPREKLPADPVSK